MDPKNFSLDNLIASMKELRQMQLSDQVRQALEGARLGVDASTLNELIHEIEHDIEEHIERLERISAVMTAEERAHPEHLDELRRREVAFKSGCDLEEVDSLCETFSRAREILAGLRTENGKGIDVRLLFSNLPGLDLGNQENAVHILRGLLDGSINARRNTQPLRKTESQPKPENSTDPAAMDNLFDLDAPYVPKNRLPKDWKP